MAKVAFLGLGMMGSQMATRLLDAGHDVTVWNRTAGRAVPLAEAGAAVAPTAGAAVGGAEFVITMLATPDALDEVLFGDQGVANRLEPGQIWIDMSTVGPDEFELATARLPVSVLAVDAPVRGSVPEANGGSLEVFVGADDATFDLVRPLLATLGHPRHMGPPGSGAATKLIVNLSLVAAMVAFGEALALADTLGLDRPAVMDVLADSPIGATVRAKRANVEAAEFPASFKLELATKDIRLVDEAAVAGGIDLPAAAAARRWMETAIDDGEAGQDFSAVAATIVSHAGRHDGHRHPVGA